MKRIKFFLIAILMIVNINLIAQVGINNDGSDPDNSAMLDVKSTNRGLLLPRMTTLQQKNIINPKPGLMIFNTDSSDFYGFNGTYWISMWECSADTISPCLLYEPFDGNTLNTDLWNIFDDTDYHEDGLLMYVNDTLIIHRGPTNDDNASYGIISESQYNNVTEASVDVWLSSLHNWQDHKVRFRTPIGNMGYYNFGAYWWVQYTNGSGDLIKENFEIGNGYIPDHKYSLRIRNTGDNLIFEWDDGTGFEEVFSTSDYSTNLHESTTEFYKKVSLVSSDRGYTKYDNVILY